MIEPIMYFGVGFLIAVIIGLLVMPQIHERAVRLTMRRLEAAIPMSVAEIQADKDLLRAEFAMSTRRLEMFIEQFKNKATVHLGELGRKSDAINRLKIEREAQKLEIVALQTQCEGLKQQLPVVDKEVATENDVVPLVPKDWPAAGLVKMLASLQSQRLNDQLHEDDVISLLPDEWRTAEDPRSGRPARDPAAAGGDLFRHITMPRQESSFSAGLRSAEPLIQVSPRPSIFVRDRATADALPIGERTIRSIARLLIAALIGVSAAFAWQSYGDEAKEVVRTWARSPG